MVFSQRFTSCRQKLFRPELEKLTGIMQGKLVLKA